MSLWESTGSILRPNRAPTPLERQAIDEVLGMATEYATLEPDRRPAFLVAAAGHTSPRQRWLTVRFTEPSDVAWSPLMRLLDALIAFHDGSLIATTHGWFDDATIRSAGGRLIASPDGGQMVQFPDAEGRYRAPGDRGPKIGRFGVGNVVPIRREAEWWEQGSEGDAA